MVKVDNYDINILDTIMTRYLSKDEKKSHETKNWKFKLDTLLRIQQSCYQSKEWNHQNHNNYHCWNAFQVGDIKTF